MYEQGIITPRPLALLERCDDALVGAYLSSDKEKVTKADISLV